MDVATNNQPALKNFDIFVAAGGQNKAIVQELTAKSDKDGKLSVSLAPSAGKNNSTLISGIEVLDNGTPVFQIQSGGSGVPQAGFASDCDPEFAVAAPLPSASGQLAWYQGHIWWHVGDCGVLVADAATGDVKYAVDPRRLSLAKQSWMWLRNRGQEIGILPGGWVAYGGRQFNLPPNEQQSQGTCTFLQATPGGALQDAAGNPKALQLDDAHAVNGLPAWDDKETLLSGRLAGFQLTALPPTLCRDLAETLAKTPTRYQNDFAPIRMATMGALNDQRREVTPPKHPLGEFYTPVLAGHAAVFLAHDYGERWLNWHVVAVSRTEQSVLWNVPLPSQPMLGGLALTRAGNVLVPLIDGRIVCIGAKGPGTALVQKP